MIALLFFIAGLISYNTEAQNYAIGDNDRAEGYGNIGVICMIVALILALRILWYA